MSQSPDSPINPQGSTSERTQDSVKPRKTRSKSGNLLTFNRCPIGPKREQPTSVPSWRYNMLPK